MAPNRQNRQLTNQKHPAGTVVDTFTGTTGRSLVNRAAGEGFYLEKARKLSPAIVSIAIPFATAYDESTLEICNLLYHHINTHHIYIIQMIKKENGSKVVGKVRNIWLCSPQSLQTLDWLMDCHSQESCEELKFPPNSVSLNL